MELRALRSFVRVVEVGSISRAAQDLDMVQSALSRHISSLEGELSTRLLHRSPHGVVPTEAGIAFFGEVQMALRHLQQASRSAQQARLRGMVSVGLAPTTASVVGLPFFLAMRERYPEVMVHLVESLSGHLGNMLDARQIDVAILFRDRVETRQGTRSGSLALATSIGAAGANERCPVKAQIDQSPWLGSVLSAHKAALPPPITRTSGTTGFMRM